MKQGVRLKYHSSSCKALLMMLLGLTYTFNSFCQDKGPGSKLSPSVIENINFRNKNEPGKYIITIKGSELPAELKKEKYAIKLTRQFQTCAFYSIWADKIDLINNITLLNEVIFIETAARIATGELRIDNLDHSVNKINLLFNRFPQWNGNGTTVSLKEDRPDSTDIDLKGRYISTTVSSAFVNSHATVMATMIAGAGNSWHPSKGPAWGANISSSNYEVLLPDPPAIYQQYNISVQNHSYGVGVESFYGADAAAYDGSAASNPSLLHVFSSGNAGAASSTSGPYAGIPGLANLTGSFKMAKNIITVGATDSFNVVAGLSSKGPAHDGRIKPELVAFGEDGSSGAAALVSGTALSLQQQYKQQRGSLPANALLKSILINSADDTGNKGPDYSSGFGALNAYKAVQTINNGHFLGGEVANGETRQFNITLPPGTRQLKLTLVWNDIPAVPNAGKALMNDLDLELVEVSTNQVWKPWVLNSYPHADSLKKPATRKRDSLNNVEQVSLNDPASGQYIFSVKGLIVGSTAQPFFLSYQIDTADRFDWNFPTGSDFIFPTANNIIRWSNTFSALTGRLEYSIDNGISWILIENAVKLDTAFYRWNVPSLTGLAQLRMTIGSNIIVSDVFTIADRTRTEVGFNCPDSFLFYWHKLPAINDYRIYRLGDRYLEPFHITADSFLVLQKSTNPSLFYAVAPLIGNKEAVRSYTFNYTIQGVDCYFRSFLASLINDRAELDLSLGTVYNLDSIILEKWNGTSFQRIQSIPLPGNISYHFTDQGLSKGANIYRVKLALSSGAVLYSNEQAIYYFANDNYIVFPNPAPRQTTIKVAVKQVEEALLQLYNSVGSKLHEQVLDDRINTIPTGKLAKGTYFIRVISNNRSVFSSSFILL